MRAWYPAGPLIAVDVLSVDGAGTAVHPQRFAHSSHFDPKHPTKEIVFPDDNSLSGITGMLDAAGTAVVNIVLHMFDEDPKAPAMQLGPDGGQTPYSFLRSDLPPKAEIVGLFLEMGPNGLRKIAPICEVPGPPKPVLVELDGVRWTNFTEPPCPNQDLTSVQLAAEGGYGTQVPPKSTFFEPKLFRVVYEPGVVTIYDQDGKLHVLKFKHVLENEDSGDKQFLFLDEGKQEVRVKFPGATRGDIEWMVDGRRMRTVKPYDEIPETDPSFGHVFSQQNSTPFDNSPFGGWDATKIDPTNFQEDSPVRNYIFAYPDINSLLYHKSERGNQKIVPNGVMYVENRVSTGNTLTKMTSSEREIQKSWEATVGAKVGFGPFSFKGSDSFRGSVKRTASTSASSTLSTFTAQSHFLFVDLPRVELHDEFVEEVKRLIHGTDVEYKSFIEAYGTHWAYATTFGARWCEQMTFTKAATVEALSAGISISTEVGGGFDGVALGGSASGKYDQSTKLGSEISNQLSIVSAVGGDATAHGVQIGASPVPIMLDLRPITDVLNAVFFTDERIYVDVKTRLAKALLDYGSVGTNFDSTPFLPTVLVVEAESIRAYDKHGHVQPGTHVAIVQNATISVELDLEPPAKADGFDGDDEHGRYKSWIWEQKTSKQPLPDDLTTLNLGIKKVFTFLGPIAPDTGLAFDVDRGGWKIPISTLTRTSQQFGINCGDYDYVVDIRLAGADPTWDTSASTGK
jgi:hypothetical protein